MPRMASIGSALKRRTIGGGIARVGGVNPNAYSPWQAPASPPPGTYDPALDAQLRAAQRGYGDLTQDTERNLQRAQSDYVNAGADIRQQSGRTLADLLRSRQRGLADYGTSETRLGEDYNRATGQKNQRYQRLGNSQSQQQRQMGGGQGVVAQALQKRMANSADEQRDLDQSRDRSLSDLTRDRTRFVEDNDLGTSRTTEDRDMGLARLSEGYGRSTSDLGTALGRAGRELGFYDQDTAGQRFFQAAESGRYTMPQRGEPGGAPSNEFQDAQGTYRVIMRGKKKVRVNPDGSVR